MTTTTHTHTTTAATSTSSIHTAAIRKDMRESAFCAELAVTLEGNQKKENDLGQPPDQIWGMHRKTD
jgi:hypothetical protein